MKNARAALTPMKLKLDDLMLDPNNPRFVESFQIQGEVPDDQVEARQVDLLGKFDTKTEDNREDDDESFFGIKGLIESMSQIGFVSIDRVVVRRIARKKSGTQKYLVIEGNRRISAAKQLRQMDRAKLPKDKLPRMIVESLELLDVLLLETEGLSTDELHDKVGVILGLRHFGSVLEWEPMPKAKNIFTEYMQTRPKLESFELESGRVSDVMQRLSLTRAEVTKALKTYSAFVQLSDALPVGSRPKPKHYSLLEALVTNSKLAAHGYIQQDDTTYRLTDGTVEKASALCQFEQRDRPDAQKILVEPKSVKDLAALVVDARGGVAGIQGYAQSLLDEVENGKVALDVGSDAMKAFKAASAWTEALAELLTKKDKELKVEEFQKDGNDRLQWEAAVEAFKNVRKILEV